MIIPDYMNEADGGSFFGFFGVAIALVFASIFDAFKF